MEFILEPICEAFMKLRSIVLNILVLSNIPVLFLLVYVLNKNATFLGGVSISGKIDGETFLVKNSDGSLLPVHAIDWILNYALTVAVIGSVFFVMFGITYFVFAYGFPAVLRLNEPRRTKNGRLR